MTEEEKEICIGKRSEKTYNKIQEMAQEIVRLQNENQKLRRQLKSEIYARDMMVSLNSDLKKENTELKEKIKEYEIGKEQE